VAHNSPETPLPAHSVATHPIPSASRPARCGWPPLWLAGRPGRRRCGAARQVAERVSVTLRVFCRSCLAAPSQWCPRKPVPNNVTTGKTNRYTPGLCRGGRSLIKYDAKTASGYSLTGKLFPVVAPVRAKNMSLGFTRYFSRSVSSQTQYRHLLAPETKAFRVRCRCQRLHHAAFAVEF